MNEVLLRIDAPWFPVTSRPPLAGEDNRRPDPAHQSLESAIINSFDERPERPYPFVAVTIGIPDKGDIPAAGAIKLLIDAVVRAGFISDDRNEIDIVRLERYRCEGKTRPTVNVKVLGRQHPTGSFIREYWPNPDLEPGSAVVGNAVAYAYVSGTPGEVAFARGPAETPAAYEEQLRELWNQVLDKGALISDDAWTDLPTVGMQLRISLPRKGNFDPDNVLLYLMDLLEVARRDALGSDAGDLTIDQLVNEIVLGRHDSSGITLEISAYEQMDETTCLLYFRNREEDLHIKWPDSEQSD